MLQQTYSQLSPFVFLSDLPTDMEYIEIYNFLALRRYPTGSSKNTKRILRRKNTENFRVKRGILFYSKIPKSRAAGKRRQWRQVPRTVEEQRRILQACHSENEGRY